MRRNGGRALHPGRRPGRSALVVTLALVLAGAMTGAAPAGSRGPAAGPRAAVPAAASGTAAAGASGTAASAAGRAAAVELPDPGRLAYVGDGPHYSLVTVGPRAALDPALPVGAAGNDCQASARGDDLVWVSDRDGTGEGVYRRTGDGPVVTVVRRTGWRVARPVLSPDRRWIAFVSWDNDKGDGDHTSISRCDLDRGLQDVAAKPAVWVVGADGTGLRQAVPDADWVDWSPDGSQFVFTRGGEAFRTPVAGGAATRVSPVDEPASHPAWEPAVPGAKDRIAYSSWRYVEECGAARSRGRALCLTAAGAAAAVRRQALVTVPAGAGGAEPAEVRAVGSNYSEAATDVAWSPDAARLAFLSQEPYLVDATGAPCACWGTPVFDPEEVVGYDTTSVGWYGPADRPRLLLGGRDPESTNLENQRAAVPTDRLQLRRLQGEEFDLADPAYAPDGRQLAFVAKSSGPDGGPDSQAIRIGDPKLLDAAPWLRYEGQERGEWESRPAWSPDGTKLAFARWVPQGAYVPPARIAVVDVSAGAEHGRLLYTVPGRQPDSPEKECDTDDLDPTWSPDGKTLAFSRYSRCYYPSLRSAGARAPAATPAVRTPAVAATVDPEPGDERDRHIWTSEARPATDGSRPAQKDVTALQCGDPDCPVLDLRPDWNRTDGTIAFVRQATRTEPGPGLRSGYEGPRAVMGMQADGTGCAGLVPRGPACPRTPPAPGRDDTGRSFTQPDNPAWTPDGSRLAVDVEVSGWDSVTNRRLMTLPRGTAAKGRILPGKIYNSQSQPSWEPGADLRVQLSTADDPVLLGRTGTLVLEVGNSGVAPAPRTRTRFTLPPGLAATGPPVPLTGTCAADLTCELGTLAGGGARTTVTLTVKALALGDHEVTAAAESALPDNKPADDTAALTVRVRVPDLAVTATATPPVIKVGEKSTLEFTVTNQGTATAQDALLRLVVPPGLTLVSGTECPPAGCAYGALAPGDTRTLTLVYTAGNAFSGTFEATVSAGTPDGDPDDDRATADLTVVDPRLPDPAVSVTVTPPVFATSARATVTYTVRNAGDATAQDVLLRTLLPPGLAVVTATPPCPDTGCALGDLAPGATVTVTRQVLAATELTGTAVGTVSTPGADSNPANNTAAAPVTVVKGPVPPDHIPPRPRLRADPQVSLSATPRTAYTGGRIDAEVTVLNGGPAKATGLRLVVAVPPGLGLVSAERPQCLTAAGCPVADLPFHGRVKLRLVLTARHALTGAITAQVSTTGSDLLPGNDAARAPLTVREPALVLDPPLGPPGSVTRAVGSQFPPGTVLRLTWSRGVTVAAAPVVVGKDGGFTAPLLILVQDTLGERKLLAAQKAPGRALFSPVTAPFLVVPGTLQPQDFQWRR
ncbi:CARDB domain-containing protein [Streptomyces sp. NPDC089919]|uniref:CARDB domain-containing protein n=1 Tax=Streptomyces sp. NPDC089919 TaxID=3155188 RepID=UPI00341C415F